MNIPVVSVNVSFTSYAPNTRLHRGRRRRHRAARGTGRPARAIPTGSVCWFSMLVHYVGSVCWFSVLVQPYPQPSPLSQEPCVNIPVVSVNVSFTSYAPNAQLLGQSHIPSNRIEVHPYSPAPCTLHPTPYTLHPTPYTLHPTPEPSLSLTLVSLQGYLLHEKQPHP